MAEKLLITLQDIKDYRPVSDMVQDRIVPYIREMQLNDLRPFLGDSLYYDLITNTGTVANQELLKGKTYVDPSTGQNIDYYGLIPFMVYHALARIVANNQINITSYGVTLKSVPQSQPATDGQIKMQITELRSVASTYQEYAKKFLNDNQSVYTLWNYSQQGQAEVTGFNFFKL